MNKKKKILLITDDIRVHSGVAHIGKEIVLKTSKYYDWVQMAGAISHPDLGKKVDLSQDTNQLTGNTDSSVILYPVQGYGNPDVLRELMEIEKPDALFLITDPRYFTWVFQMENEIRKKIPIIYLNIWDNYPAPAYNKEFYESCDMLLGISKQTVNINKIVLGEAVKDKIIEYVPHGLDHKVFYPIEGLDTGLMDFKQKIFRDKEYGFTLLFNSRNIRRKNIPNTILAWKIFIDGLTQEKREKCLLLLHTQPIDEHGTDLPALIEYLFPEGNSQISILPNALHPEHMNYLYNLSDGVILLSTAEGWGLSLTEAMLTGKPFIANVTGGMQDQMCFLDKNGDWFTPSKEIPSNHKGTLKIHGKWAFPVFPSNTTIVGSVPTPYIYDDYCSPEDAAKQINELYNVDKKERKYIGNLGRKWAIGNEAGFTAEQMGSRVYKNIEKLFKTWKPREEFEFYKDTDYVPSKLEHELNY